MRFHVISVLAGMIFNTGLLHANTEGFIASAGLGYLDFAQVPQSPLIISNVIADTLHEHQQHHYPQLFASFKKNYLGSDKGPFTSWALGPALYYQKVRYTGDVWELNDSLFNNYSYEYTNHSLNAYLEGEFYLRPIFLRLQPFLTAGIGISGNATQYDDWAKPPIAMDSEIHLAKRHNLQFAYELGAGLMAHMTQKMMLSLRYNYQDSGEASTQTSFNLLAPVTLRLTSHSVLFGVHYLV